MVLAAGGPHPHALGAVDFDALFTPDCAVHMNFHGYPIELKGLLFGRPRLDRITIEGYREEGTTTSPLDMMLVNHTSWYHVAAAAVRGGAQHNPRIRTEATELAARFMPVRMTQKDHEYIYKYGEDPVGAFDTPRFG